MVSGVGTRSPTQGHTVLLFYIMLSHVCQSYLVTQTQHAKGRCMATTGRVRATGSFTLLERKLQ